MKRMYHFGLYDFADGFISECLATDVEAAQNILINRYYDDNDECRTIGDVMSSLAKGDLTVRTIKQDG